MLTLVLIVLFVLAVGAAPPYNPFPHPYGYTPSISLGGLLLVLLILMLLGVL